MNDSKNRHRDIRTTVHMRNRKLEILVLGKDQGRCGACQAILPIPVSGRSTLEDVPYTYLAGSNTVQRVKHLPDFCIPNSLPAFIVEKFLIQDLREAGEEVGYIRAQWEWDGCPHECGTALHSFVKFYSGIEAYIFAVSPLCGILSLQVK